MGIESDSIKTIREAAIKVARTTPKGSLLAKVSPLLPCDITKQKRESQKEQPTIEKYGSPRTNSMWTNGEGRVGTKSGHGHFPTYASTEIVGIASHDDCQDGAYRYGD